MKKFASAILIISFMLSIAPVQPALALRNPQAKDALAVADHISVNKTKKLDNFGNIWAVQLL